MRNPESLRFLAAFEAFNFPKAWNRVSCKKTSTQMGMSSHLQILFWLVSRASSNEKLGCPTQSPFHVFLQFDGCRNCLGDFKEY